ncbi:MAG: hypothetical protein JRI28_03545 [Deltaproteobacteria bacterium]|nr:hypothetical protein [Deltaproteobacteria bacterium]
MRKQRSQYDSPVDALVAVAKRLSVYESRHHMTSEDFFDKYCKGQLDDSVDFVEWSNDYQHYMAIKIEIERHLQDVA